MYLLWDVVLNKNTPVTFVKMIAFQTDAVTIFRVGYSLDVLGEKGWPNL